SRGVPLARLRRVLAQPSTASAALCAGTVLAFAFGWIAQGYTHFVLAMVALNIVVGVGLNILVGLSGLVSFGHVAFYAIGAYVAGIGMAHGFSFWLMLPLAALTAAALGGLLAVPALRVKGPYLAMVTIAFAFIVEHGAVEWRSLTGGANGLMGFDNPQFFGIPMMEREVALLAVVLAGLALAFFHRFSRSHWGRALRAVRDSETAAQSLGFDPVVIKTMAFALSACFTGIAGAVFVPLVMFISPSSFPFSQSILFLLAVVIGGSGTLFGPVVGALIVVLLPEALSNLAEYRLLAFGSLLLGVLWLAPRGIVGTLATWLAHAPDSQARRDDARVMSHARRADSVPLSVKDIGIRFGGVQAAKGVSFTAAPACITSVIGPNGAGKTTVLNMVGGFYRPDSGSIDLNGELAGLRAWQIARAGIARTYQTTQLFEQMSVLDNLRIALRAGRSGALLGGVRTQDDDLLAQALLAFVGYSGSVTRMAADLPHVDRRLVEIARALATRPGVLLLDEPAAGLMRADKDSLAVLLRRIAALGIAVILVEHDMALVMGVSDHVVVLDAGVPIAQGAPRDVQQDAGVLRAYLGATDFVGRPRPAPWQGPQLAVLAAVRVRCGYGAAPVLDEVSVVVNPGEMVAVLGANGAGKSTLMRAISGLLRPVDGAVLLDDRDIRQEAAHDIARAGLALVPEGRQVFPELSVRDNIMLGAYHRREVSAAQLEAEFSALLTRFPRLKDRIDSPAGVLSGGEQQMLAIARGLMAAPRILLLDEPSLGLSPAMIAELYGVLADLRDEGTTLLIVDQMANLALAVADRAYVLESGRLVREGKVAELRDDPAIARAYLGHA
ncbi:MAG: ATP-binding cassette domain-containing protein, partial [Rhodocyclaceae bacterium]